MKFPSFSLRQTLMLGVAAGILLPALFFAGFQVTSKLETEVALRVEAPLKQYADVLSRGMAVAVWNLDRGVAIELVEAVMRNPDPPNYFASKYSLPHAAACLIVNGSTGYESLNDAALADPVIAAN